MELSSRLRILSAVALAGLATCDGLDNIDVDAGGQSSIPAATPLDMVLGALDFEAFSSLDFSQEFRNQGVAKDDVDSVHLVSMTLTITDPPGASFDFLDSIVFYMQTEGQPRIEIARMSPVPPGMTQLTLDVAESAELEPYVVAPKLEIVSEVEGSLPPQETTVDAQVVFDVDVTIPGC
jgi:hypothetical protein